MLNKSCLKQFHQLVNITKPNLNYLDSGGFSISKYEADDNIKASKILERLTTDTIMHTANIINATTVFALDIPLLGYKDPQKQNREFAFKSQLNLRLARDALVKHRQICPTKELFLPLQFYNLDQLLFFIDCLKLPPNSVGAAFPVRDMTIPDVVKAMYSLKSYGFKKIHLLGTSSAPFIMISSYMARHYFERVTTDSTTWMIAAQYLKYWEPGSMKAKLLNGKKQITLERHCNCTACQYFNFNEYWKIPKTELVYALGYHNSAVLNQICKDILKHSGSITLLSKYVQDSGFHKTVKKRMILALDALSFFRGAWMLCGPEMGLFL
jgi:tRNA-guanine family transglycosylase